MADVQYKDYIIQFKLYDGTTRNIPIRIPLGEPFRYEDFTPEQLEALRGPAFTFDDFTPEQLQKLTGKSAYDYATEAGFSGTEKDFAEKLASGTVLYTKQTLTEEQKAQARENIGVSDWTLVDHVITEEKVATIVIPMGEHKIKSKDQQMMIVMKTPANSEASGDLLLSIDFNDDLTIPDVNVCLYRAQSPAYGAIPKDYRIEAVYHTKFIEGFALTQRTVSNFGANAYPQPEYGSIGNISGFEFGSSSFDLLVIHTHNITVYPSFPIGTEVRVYVK